MDVPGKLKQIDIALRKCKDPTKRTALMTDALDLIIQGMRHETNAPGRNHELGSARLDDHEPKDTVHE